MIFFSSGIKKEKNENSIMKIGSSKGFYYEKNEELDLVLT